MSVSGVLWSFVIAGLAATGPLVAPSELVLDSLPGFERTGEAMDLTFEEFATLEPDSIGHLEPDSDQASGMMAAIGSWSGAGSTILVTIVLAIDERSATTFVDQMAANAIAVGLAATDPPFVGAWSYSGGIDDWTNVVSWNQGPYAVTVTQRSDRQTDRADIDAAAVRQAERILESTGIEVSDDAAVGDDGPPPPTAAPSPTAAPPTDDGIELPLVAGAVLVVAAAASALVLFRRRRGATVDA